MAVMKYDVSGVEPSGGGGPQPKPGVYKGKITKFDLTKPDGKDRRLELIFEVVGKGEFAGAKLYEYVNVESEAAAWKLRQLTDALGLRPKGSINTDKHMGTVLQLQVQGDTYNGEYRARVGRMMPLPADEPDDVDEDEENGDDEDEADEYDEMSLKELRAACKEAGLSTRGTQEALIERLREADAADEDEDEDEEAEAEAEAEDEAGDAETYDDWDLAELKDELKQRGLRTVGSKKALVARLEKDDASSEGPF